MILLVVDYRAKSLVVGCRTRHLHYIIDESAHFLPAPRHDRLLRHCHNRVPVRIGFARLGHRRRHRRRTVLAKTHVVHMDQPGQGIGLRSGGPCIAGVDHAHRRNAHRRTGTRHIAQRRHARRRVHPQLGRRVQHRLKKLADLVAENRPVLIHPLPRPIVHRRIAVRLYQRIG